MDYCFPEQLFPSFYNSGPPDSVLRHCAGNWGCYDRVRAQGGSAPLSSQTFTSQHQVRGETWSHTEPAPIPLFSPHKTAYLPSTPPDPLNFREHMQNFFKDHCQDAFSCMGEILGENFNFTDGRKKRNRKNSVHMWKVKNFLDMLNVKICQMTYTSRTLDGYSSLLSDVVHAIPPELLGSLLHEELTEQRDRLLFSEGATGGSLAFIPFSQSCSDAQHGCLIYPGSQALDRLNFHRVELKSNSRGSPFVDSSSSGPLSFQLKGPVRQISTKSLLNQSCVAVRSDHLCGVWRLCETTQPHLLQVVNTTEIATCISVSPHVLGEVLVASESGAANLWTVGKGIQQIREEDGNLYFNANSSWRWCEFTAHPRVMLFADRTGAELTDIRVSPAVSHTLFRVSNSSECRSGERLILSRYLGDAHSFHHLVTTQYSAYVMDERFPGVPMLKWDHLMKSPPIFCHIISGSAEGADRTSKVLLGSQSTQEITMLQYLGGRVYACSSQGPPQALLRPTDSVQHLPLQIPHRLESVTNRLSLPAAGLTCIQQKGGHDTGLKESICVLQLTEAGDIFYQFLKPEQSDTSPPQPVDGKNVQEQTLKEATLPHRKKATGSHLVVSETSSDEGIIGPTQAPTALRLVAETPEKKQPVEVTPYDWSSDDSESEFQRSQKLRKLKLQVVVNDADPTLEDDSRAKDGKEGEIDSPEETGSVEEAAGSSGSLSRHVQTPVKLSNGALATWKLWLHKLVQKSRKKKPTTQHLPYFTVQTEKLLHPFDGKLKDLAEEKRVQTLRRDLRACMSKRSLLVHKNLSNSLKDPDLEPLPNQVDTDAWTDPLSQRLTLSWQGEEVWRAWWEDNLGLNKEQKMEALRRKRRREKAARRASGGRTELSGSFTSSLSYQSELSDFADSQGWSSAASQGAWSDTETMKSQSENIRDTGTPRTATPSVEQTEGPVSVPPQSVTDKPAGPLTRSSPRTLTPTPRVSNTPVSQRENKCPAVDVFSTQSGPQDESSQAECCLQEEDISMLSARPPVASSASQLRSSWSVSQRGVRVNLFQETFSLSQSQSQSQSLSQSSQRRLPQMSQPKKKKSRMGF